MCGIVGYVGPQNAKDVLINGLSKLEYRGYDSAGISIFVDNVIKTIKAKGRLKNLEDLIEKDSNTYSNCGIGHTRWATHGEPSDINSHPHGSGVVSIVHNGIIENYAPLRDSLIEQGETFLSQTDSEVVAHLLENYYEGNPLQAIRKTVARLKGSYAFGIIFHDFPEKLFALRKESPLIVAKGNGENFIASDVPAILKFTKDYYLIEEGEIAEITADNIRILDFDENEIDKPLQTATWDIDAAEKGGYEHFMLKEIHEQPQAFMQTISPRIANGLPSFVNENIPDEFFKDVENLHIVACGTAMHAGMVGKYLIEDLAKIPCNVDIASEFRYRNPILKKNDAVIIISQSGETADTIAALRLAKQKGIKTLAIVNVVGSSIAREADYVVYTWAGPEIAVASTKAYYVQLSVFYLLATKLALAKGEIDEDKSKSIIASLCEIPDYAKKLLADTTTYKHHSSLFQNAKHLFYIGRGLDYSLSLEASLKLKEISYIHSEAYAAGELKHGTISLVTDNMPVVAVATQDALLEKTLSNIKEVKSRGAHTLVLAKEGANIPRDCADHILTVAALDDFFMPLLAIIPLQLFAYYTSVLRGCDVDKPRNLAKSVTVE